MNRRHFNRILAASPAVTVRISALATGTTQRRWIGPPFWANSLPDWRLRDGRIECSVSGGERNVYLLTHQVLSSPGTMAAVQALRAGRCVQLIRADSGEIVHHQGTYTARVFDPDSKFEQIHQRLKASV